MTMTHPRLLLTHPRALLLDKPRRAYDNGDEGEKVSVGFSGLKAAGIEIDDVVVTPTP
jgi:ABC-type uncharacterized transport system YnjBCD ATPase subunit